MMVAICKVHTFHEAIFTGADVLIMKHLLVEGALNNALTAIIILVAHSFEKLFCGGGLGKLPSPGRMVGYSERHWHRRSQIEE